MADSHQQARPNCLRNQPIWVTKRQKATDRIRCVAVNRIDAVVSRNMSNPDGRTSARPHAHQNFSKKPFIPASFGHSQLSTSKRLSDHRHPPSLNTHPHRPAARRPAFTRFIVAKVSKVFTLPKAMNRSHSRATCGSKARSRTIRTKSPVGVRQALRSRSTHAAPSAAPAPPSSRRSVRPARARRWAGRTTAPASGRPRRAG